ncbi:MAG: hypothetical protein KDD69_16245 [Bdellovibrionales bacterium]|nr:hypothetical protein [Bdellovibrionales bacterium]
MRPVRLIVLGVALLLGAVAAAPCSVKAEQEGVRARAGSDYTTYTTPRFTLYIGSDSKPSEPINADEVAEQSLKILNTTYEELSRIFRTQPKRKVVLRFLSPTEFRRQTGAPEWTSAMYFRDEITIPLTKANAWERDELHRALRHEYVHAVIAELSDYRCPAWLDEGVAQLLEGQINPLLGPALRRWVGLNPAIPLEWLQNGFTTLESAYVPAAYAQSLFATRKLIQQHGFQSVTNYLADLRKGVVERKAFERSFYRPKAQFERELTREMRRWAASREVNP